MKLRMLTLFLILFSAGELFSGSYFTIRRLGNIQVGTQADFAGRGGTGIGVADRMTINPVNPAGLVLVDLTRFTGHFINESLDIKTSNSNAQYSYANFAGVNLSIPIMVDKLVISLGLRPISQNDFEAETEGELSTGNHYVKEVINKGGINKISIGAGYGFKKKVFAGFYFNHNFGRIEENWKVDFTSDLFVDTSDKLISTLWGQNLTLGTMIRVTDYFTLGAVYSTKTTLSVNNHIEYTFGESTETVSQKMKLPFAWGVGTSYVLKRRLRMSADYFNRSWSKIELDNEPVGDYNDLHSYSMGLEYLPFGKVYRGIHKKLTYRIGFNYSDLAYTDANGGNVSEYIGTFGLGLPFYSGRGRFDIAFGFGKRGDINSNGAEESIFKFMMSVSGAEKWFFRPE